MLSGPITELESRFARNLSTFSGEKDSIQEQLGYKSVGRVGTGSEGLEHPIFGSKQS